MPEVSVVIPVYNVEPYLRECLDSVLNQTFKDIEVICVDDGSTDGSVSVLNEYADKDGRVKVVTAEHKNAGAARNIGYGLSKGKYLLFLDADDVFAPNMIQVMRDALLLHQADVANCSKQDFLSGKPLPELARGDVGNFKVLDNSKRQVNCFKEFVGWAWDKLFSRSLVEKYDLHFQEQQAHNDFFFCNCACCLADKIVKTNDVFIAHRKHETSIAMNRDKSPLCFSSALHGFYRKLDSCGYWEKYPKQLRYYNNYVVELGFWTIDTLKTREAIELAYAELRKMLQEQDALDKDKTYMDIYPQWYGRYLSLCKHDDALLFWREAAIEERKGKKWLQNKFRALQKESADIRSEHEATRGECDRLRMELREVRGSRSYRIAKGISNLLRPVLFMFKGSKTN